MKNLFVSMAAAAAVFSYSTVSMACGVSCSFDSVLSATQHLVTPMTARGGSQADPSAQVVQVASLFSQMPNEDGETIYPEGTVVDRAEIDGQALHVWITFPSTVQKNSLDEFTVYHGAGILRHHFSETYNLTATIIHARSSAGEDYVSLEEYIYRETPGDAMVPRGEIGLDYEIDGPGPQPDIDLEPIYEQIRQEAAGITTRDLPGQGSATSSGMPAGSLAGKIIFTYGGHGRTWDGRSDQRRWRWQRGYTHGMLEDFGNTDASDYYAMYCFNAGATVVSFRPIGYQDNEVVLDNTSPGVTRTGNWNNSTNARYYGSGTPNYYWASSSNTQTATVTYTPNIPEAGYYPVYTWANYGSDRIPGGQLYRIRSTGGESLVRIDHRRVGCGWVYLGSYYFEAGSNAAQGSVVISNENPTGVTGSNYVAIADAIRFGNGMGDVNKGGGISGYSRREESTVYWLQNGWGNGTSAGTWTAAQVWNNGNNANDESRSWSAVPRMAAQMLRLHSGDSNKEHALYLGWHSNASSAATARGSMGLITGSPTTNQAWWAARTCDLLDAHSLAEHSNWEHNWFNRSAATYTGAYGEITNSHFQSKMDATIIEVAFHSNAQDAALMRDPKVRSVHGRATYHAAVQYANNFWGRPLVYSPERPRNFRVKNNGNGSVTLGWIAGLTGASRGHAATSYRVYQSPDGMGWGGGELVTGLTKVITGLTPGQTYYFRVSGVNAGGESFPTETLGVRITPSGAAKVLVVNGFDRLDRFNNVPRPAGLPGIPEQLQPLRNNTYDYVRQHGEAIAAAGRYFDSTSNEAIISNQVSLNDYDTVVWIMGEESSQDNTFNATERARVESFLSAGKSLFVSGSEIAYELDSMNRGRAFYRNSLGAQYAADSAASYTADGAPGSVFDSITGLYFGPSATMYDVDSPDVITPVGGSVSAMHYGASQAILDTFDSIGNWQRPDWSGTTTADSSTFAIVASPRQQGSGSGRLNYNWTEGTVLRLYSSASPSFPKTARVSLWVYGDNSGHSFRIFVRDSVDGELFQSPLRHVNWTGWQEITWDLATAPVSKFAGTGDNVITGDVRIDSIYMTKVGASTSGNVYLDNATYTMPAVGNRTAAVQYAGDYKLVNLAFPFEAIQSSAHRDQVMLNALNFFEQPHSNVADWSVY